MQPNTTAILAAFCFGIIVFPWREAVERIGTGGVFLAIGSVYVVFGLVQLHFSPTRGTMEWSDIGYGAMTALIDLVAVVAFSYAVAHPLATLPTVSALVAAAPLFTLMAAVLVLRQPVTLREGFFVILTVIGIAGLGLSSHSP